MLFRRLITAGLALSLLAACAAPATSQPTAAPATGAPEPTTAPAGNFPVTLTDGSGVALTFDVDGHARPQGAGFRGPRSASNTTSACRPATRSGDTGCEA